MKNVQEHNFRLKIDQIMTMSTCQNKRTSEYYVTSGPVMFVITKFVNSNLYFIVHTTPEWVKFKWK